MKRKKRKADKTLLKFAEELKDFRFRLWSEVEWDAEGPGIFHCNSEEELRSAALRHVHSQLEFLVNQLKQAAELPG